MLHGLCRTSHSMAKMECALTNAGFKVRNVNYPSRTASIQQLADDAIGKAVVACQQDGAKKIDFVTHSLGGILVRSYLARHSVPSLGRVVMLAPPNQGSAVADRLRHFPPFRWFTGVNGARLGTGADALPRALGPWPDGIDLGIIAGNRTLNPLFSAWLDGANDGKVSVTSTHLAGMHDHLVLPHSHTWLQWRADTARAVSRFLQHGRFGSSATGGSSRS